MHVPDADSGEAVPLDRPLCREEDSEIELDSERSGLMFVDRALSDEILGTASFWCCEVDVERCLNDRGGLVG